MSSSNELRVAFKALPMMAKVGLVLLLGGAALAILAIIWLVVFGVTNGAAPIPTPPGAPPTPALVMLGLASAAVVFGFLFALIFWLGAASKRSSR
jgi:hypothetical protein